MSTNPTATESLGGVASIALRNRVESAADGESISSIALATYSDLAGILVPLIGDAGVKALTSRALHLARQQFPVDTELAAAADATSDPLAAWLKRVDSSDVLEAAASMLSSLAGLLGTFIGEALTMRLLRKAWRGNLPGMEPGESP